MCPYARSSSSISIGVDWTDEKIMLFLVERKKENPLPSNVVADVNPFSMEPWKVPDNTWFLCNSYHSDYQKGGKVRDVGDGYWKENERNLKIFPDRETEGRKISWEFYTGVAPAGNRTGWTMLEYKMEHKEHQGERNEQDFSSLCGVYWCDINLPVCEEECNHVGADDAEGDYLQSALLTMIEDEERNSHLSRPANNSQVAHGDEEGPLPLSERKQDPRPNDSNDFLAAFEFSDGDFLELNDFDNLGSSSSSDNTSCVSRTSDEYFDSEALLRDLGNETYQVTRENHEDHHFSIHESLEPDHVITGSSPPGSMHQNDPNILMQSAPSNSAAGRQQEKDPTRSLSDSELPSNRKVSKSGWGEGSRSKRAASRSPQGSGSSSRSSQGSGTQPGGRIAKFGKKYCCFVPF